ncbi:hypothetical protein GGR57DRAFT_311641 [Xylariaceae sp. FL1272]|nr:hypothetical protein GGR57DRAFT_311641 [Xylariaceae sp. FL1272]
MSIMDPAIVQQPSFTNFACLPKELRLTIWECCLPNRVAEVCDALLECITRDICKRNGLEYRPRRTVPLVPPLISRVCQEARKVALHRSALQLMGISKSEAWFDKRTDAISIDPAVPAWLRNHTMEHSLSVLPAYRYLSDIKIPICIASRIIEHDVEHKQWLKENISTWYTLPRTPGELIVQSILKRPSCTVILGRLALHLSHHDACESGLFGLFAESNPAYIDLDNPGQVQKVLAARTMKRKLSCDTRCGSWGLEDIESQRWVADILPRRIAYFLDRFKELKSHIEMVAEINKVPGQEDCLEHSSRTQMPQFSFVMAVYLCQSLACQNRTGRR